MMPGFARAAGIFHSFVEGIMSVNAVTTSSSAAVQAPPAPPAPQPKPAQKPAAEQVAAPPPPPPAPAVNTQGQKIGTTISTTA